MSGVSRSIDRPASASSPPAFGAGGGHPRWVETGWGVNGSEDARHCSVLYICKYFVISPIISWLVVIAYLFCNRNLHSDCGWEIGIPTDYSLYQSWQWWISLLIIIHLFCTTELVREDCGGGTVYSLYQSWQWWISGLVIIHLFCATELVWEDCGGGTDYSLY
jgi:hypothetical protein